MLRRFCILLLPLLITGQEFQCGTDKIQSDIAKTVVQFNCKDKVSDINKCCITHDGCYDQQQPRVACDTSFCACVQAASAGNPLCGFYTSIFCDTAKVFGEAAYKKAGEAKGKDGAASTSETPSTSAPTPSPYAKVAPGQTAAEAVAAAQAVAAKQAAAYRATTSAPASSSDLLFTPFPDPMNKLREWMNPTPATPAPVTISPDEIERQRVQDMAKAAFERSVKQSKQSNAQQRLREHEAEELTAAKMRAMAERKHIHPTATPPTPHQIEQHSVVRPTAMDETERQRMQTLARSAYEQHQRSKISARSELTQRGMITLTPEQEELIAERVRKELRASIAQPGLKKIAPASDDAFSEDEDDEVQQKEENVKTSVRRAPASTRALITLNNLFHNDPSNSEPAPFAEAKISTTTPLSVFHQKSSFPVPDVTKTVAPSAENDPSASIFDQKDPQPITEFLNDHAALETLSSIDVGGKGDHAAEEDEKEELLTRTAKEPVREGFSFDSDAGPFESLLKEAQEKLRESQHRVDELIKDQRLKIEREETERKRLIEKISQRRHKIAEQRRLLEERKKRREQKKKERLARQRELIQRTNDNEWSRRLDQEAKVKALEDSTRSPVNSLEIEVSEQNRRVHHDYLTTTVKPYDYDTSRSRSEEASHTPKRNHSRHAKNELDSDSYEAYEQWLRWREKRRLARRNRKFEAELESEE